MLAGAVSGVIAAVVMLMVASIGSAMQGTLGLEPVLLIAATFLGEDAFARPVRSSIVGVGVHVVIGAGFGTFFGAVTHRLRSRPLLIAAGMAYGAIIFLFMAYLVLPQVNPRMLAFMVPGWFFLYHLAFGLTLALAMLVARKAPWRYWFADRPGSPA
jgi:hypothetical protein